MASYEQIGKKICPKCKTECTTKKCPACGATAKGNGKWTVRFRNIEFGKLSNKRLSGFDSKKEAETAYQKYEKSLNLSKKMTLQELYDSYDSFIASRLKSSSIVKKESVIKLHILPNLKDRYVSDLTVNDIVLWQSKLLKENNFKFRYLDSIYSIFCSIINYSIKYHGITENVVSKVGNFTNNEQKVEMLYWTEEEFKKFIKVVDDMVYKTFFSFLYLTGCRKGEAYALNWNDIDFNTKILKIRKTLNIRGLSNKPYEISTPKTKSSNRDILLPNNLIALLEKYYEYCKKTKGFKNECFIFGIFNPLPTETVRRKLEKYCIEAKVKKIRIHDFRHSHASLLINKGQNILIVAQRLGHTNIQQTLNTYSHLFPNKQTEIIEALNIEI